MSEVHTTAPSEPNSQLYDRLLALAGSPALAVANVLLLATTLLLVCSCDRSVLTGLLILAWGAAACHLAYHAGSSKRLDGTKVVLVYLGLSVLLFVVINGLYRLLGV